MGICSGNYVGSEKIQGVESMENQEGMVENAEHDAELISSYLSGLPPLQWEPIKDF